MFTDNNLLHWFAWLVRRSRCFLLQKSPNKFKYIFNQLESSTSRFCRALHHTHSLPMHVHVQIAPKVSSSLYFINDIYKLRIASSSVFKLHVSKQIFVIFQLSWNLFTSSVKKIETKRQKKRTDANDLFECLWKLITAIVWYFCENYCHRIQFPLCRVFRCFPTQPYLRCFVLSWKTGTQDLNSIFFFKTSFENEKWTTKYEGNVVPLCKCSKFIIVQTNALEFQCVRGLLY